MCTVSFASLIRSQNTLYHFSIVRLFFARFNYFEVINCSSEGFTNNSFILVIMDMTSTVKLIDRTLISCMWAPPHTGNAGQFVMMYMETGYNRWRILVVLLVAWSHQEHFRHLFINLVVTLP
jgi:hypothetical protein